MRSCHEAPSRGGPSVHDWNQHLLVESCRGVALGTRRDEGPTCITTKAKSAPSRYSEHLADKLGSTQSNGWLVSLEERLLFHSYAIVFCSISVFTWPMSLGREQIRQFNASRSFGSLSARNRRSSSAAPGSYSADHCRQVANKSDTIL